MCIIDARLLVVPPKIPLFVFTTADDVAAVLVVVVVVLPCGVDGTNADVVVVKATTAVATSAAITADF